MKCRAIRYCLPEYVQGKAPEDEARAVSDHLALCGRCRSEAEELTSLISSIPRQTVRVPPAPYWASVLPRIHDRLDARISLNVLPESFRLLLPVSVAMVLIVAALNVRPMKSVVESQEIHALVHQLPAEELNQVAQQDEVDEAYQASAVFAVPGDVQPSDKEVVKAYMLEGESIDFSSELDPEFNIGSVSDEIVDELMTKLEHEQAMN